MKLPANTMYAAIAILLSPLLLSVSSSSVPGIAYASDTAAPAWRVEVELPEEAAMPAEAGGWWARLRTKLGARAPQPRFTPGTKLTVQSSAYAPSPFQTDSTPCITASGTRVRPGVVATNFLPLGTILLINGERFIVEDRMNSRYQGKYLDVWFPSTEEALEFGRKSLEVIIVDYGTPGQDLLADTPAFKPTLLKRANLRFIATSRTLSGWLLASVNRHDVNCEIVTE